jgi:hypothetical protein
MMGTIGLKYSLEMGMIEDYWNIEGMQIKTATWFTI